MDSQPLNELELDRLGHILSEFRGGGALNLEGLDGYLAALACCPEALLPWEYLPPIWGTQAPGIVLFPTYGEWQAFTGLVMRHQHSISATLESGQIHLPLLFVDMLGNVSGNDWADGFLLGMNVRRTHWLPLLSDDILGGLLLPVLALVHEHSPDIDLRPYLEPMTTSQRDQVLSGVAANLLAMYQHFLPVRERYAQNGRGRAGVVSTWRITAGTAEGAGPGQRRLH